MSCVCCSTLSTKKKVSICYLSKFSPMASCVANFVVKKIMPSNESGHFCVQFLCVNFRTWRSSLPTITWLMDGGGWGCLWLVDGQTRGLLGSAGTCPRNVAAKAHWSGRPRIEAWGHRVGGSNEWWWLLQRWAGLQEAGLLLEGWGLAMERGRSWQWGP